MKTYTHMTIGVCLSNGAAREFQHLADSHLSNLADSHLSLTHVGAITVVLELAFTDRESCVRYHSSRAYRQFVEATQHLGTFMTKLFESIEEVTQ